METFYNLALEAYTSKKKHSIIYNVESVINASGAWITDFKSLSEKMINFVFECDQKSLLKIYDRLLEKAIMFYPYSVEQLNEISFTKKKGELLISLSINFVGGEKGDLGTKVA